MGVNDVDEQCIVTYEILMVASFCCAEWHGSQKDCNTLGAAYPRVNLSDVNGLECLTQAICDGVCAW